MEYERKWWKEAVVYQIYPRSFCDSNADGIGDLKGVISKLDYIKELGADVIWLCPIYKSPNDDNGYDISDYYEIMSEFGTMADFEELLNKAHSIGIKLIMDLVLNHTSDEHPWFVEARKSKQSPKRDYYIWRPGINGNEPNNWESFFTQSAWEYDSESGEYYLHIFSSREPDLNWRNENLRGEMYSMMTWWLDKGIDGFRLDVINCISKPVEMPDVSPSSKKYEWAGKYFINEPDVHKYIKEMYEKVLSKYDILTVGQTLDVSPENALLYNQSEKKQIEMVFHFELDHIDEGPGGKWEEKKWRLSEFKRIINKWQVGQYNKGWNSVYFGNHDQPRMVSRFGNDSIYRIASAKMLATLQLTLGGTPYIFQGDEIGMTNMTFRTIEDFRDIEATKYYKSALENGMGKFEILSNIRRKSRDNGRTPMQWNGTDNAGFSQGKPWIGVNRNYHYINVENDLKKKDSIINYYRRLIMLRRDYPTFVYGNFTLLCEDSEEIMVYLRESDENCFLVVLNFTDKHIVYEQPVELKKYYSSLLIGNLKDGNYFLQNKSILEPYEALVFKLL